MSLMMSIRRKPTGEVLDRVDRLRSVYRQGASAASVAVARIGPAARNTRAAAAERLLVARGWSAPRLRRAGTYVETELGPRLGAMLTSAAGRVEPPRPTRRGRSAMVTTVAAVSAAGLAGALLTRRSGAQSGPVGRPGEGASATAPADVDGQVRTP